MKVLQVLPYFPPHAGWLEQVAAMISKYFVKWNYGEMMNLIFSVWQEKESWVYQKDGATIVVLPAFDLIYSFPFPKFWKKSFWSGMKEAKRFNADVIQTHTRFFLSTFLGGMLAKSWKKKWVHVEHGGGHVDDVAWWKRGIARLYDQTIGRLVLGTCDKVISISQANVPFISRFCPKKKIELVYNGIEFPLVSLKKDPFNFPRLAYIGRLAPGKGVHVLLEAVKKLKDGGVSDFSLDIIGDGEARVGLEKYVKDYGLQHVRFLWKMDREQLVHFLVKHVDMLVNPSFREGLPTSVLEGLLAKCVVIATDVGGTKEISDKKDLILVEPRNVEMLAEMIEKTLLKVKRLQGLSWESVQEKFDWECSVKGYVKVYEKVSIWKDSYKIYSFSL